jgi:hypothetical protein
MARVLVPLMANVRLAAVGHLAMTVDGGNLQIVGDAPIGLLAILQRLVAVFGMCQMDHPSIAPRV